MKRARITVRWSRADRMWLVDDGVRRVTFRLKVNARQAGIDGAKAQQPSQLVILNKNGRISEERTYPRASDPRRTRG